jgi:hypothetical protein
MSTPSLRPRLISPLLDSSPTLLRSRTKQEHSAYQDVPSHQEDRIFVLIQPWQVLKAVSAQVWPGVSIRLEKKPRKRKNPMYTHNKTKKAILLKIKFKLQINITIMRKMPNNSIYSCNIQYKESL